MLLVPHVRFVLWRPVSRGVIPVVVKMVVRSSGKASTWSCAEDQALKLRIWPRAHHWRSSLCQSLIQVLDKLCKRQLAVDDLFQPDTELRIVQTCIDINIPIELQEGHTRDVSSALVAIKLAEVSNESTGKVDDRE